MRLQGLYRKEGKVCESHWNPAPSPTPTPARSGGCCMQADKKQKSTSGRGVWRPRAPTRTLYHVILTLALKRLAKGQATEEWVNKIVLNMRLAGLIVDNIYGQQCYFPNAGCYDDGMAVWYWLAQALGPGRATVEWIERRDKRARPVRETAVN